MKTKLLAIAGVLAIFGLGACSHHSDHHGDRAKDETKVFTGVLPAADAEGVRYTLALDYDDDNNYTDGDYDLVQSYLVTDSLAKTGLRDSVNFKSKGDFRVMTGTGDNAGVKYLKLVPKRGMNDTGDLYFIEESDSSLVLVNADLTRSETPGLNYTLKLVK